MPITHKIYDTRLAMRYCVFMAVILGFVFLVGIFPLLMYKAGLGKEIGVFGSYYEQVIGIGSCVRKMYHPDIKWCVPIMRTRFRKVFFNDSLL
jgi:hypothetical protein